MEQKEQQRERAKNERLVEHIINKDEVQSLAHIYQELKIGFDLLKQYPRSVTIFGSARSAPHIKPSQAAETLARRIVTELGYAVVTGGGPGIMGAANKGAFEANGHSLGISIRLPHEQKTNPYVTHEASCRYFFTRKTILAFAAEAYVYFPGGFGTLDELFGITTLIQTGKIPPAPIILYDSVFWKPIVEVLHKQMVDEYKTVSMEEMKILFTITDSLDEIIAHAKAAPVHRWWRHIEG